MNYSVESLAGVEEAAKDPTPIVHVMVDGLFKAVERVSCRAVPFETKLMI